MIRGAIALGLAIKAEHFFTQYEFVVASVLALVIASTLLFGSFMPLVAKCLLDKPARQQNHTTQPTVSNVDEPSHSMASPNNALDPHKTPLWRGEDSFSTPRAFHSLEQ